MNWERFKTEADALAYVMDTKGINAKQARKYLQANLPKEAHYQDKVIKHIRALIPSAFVWKATAGPYSRQGIPDVCAVIHGKYYGFEIKRPFVGILSPIQEQTIRQIEKAGGRAYVVTYPAEVTEILREEIERDGNGKD